MEKVEKSSDSVSIIGGSDGPTTIFLAGSKKKTIKQKLHKRIFDMRKKWYATHIKPGTHTMDEVIAYIKEKYGFVEISKDTKEYVTQYDALRTSFIMQYAPELLGEYATPPKLISYDEAGVRAFEEQFEIRRKKAGAIPEDEFSIDFHILKKTENENNMHIDIESNFGLISGGFSGPGKGGKRRFSKIYKDVYRYYGVAETDIINETKRYKELLTTLAMRH